MLNQVQLIGRLGNEPEVRTTANGDKVANFSVATTETWVKDGERKSKTTWIRIEAWGNGTVNAIEKYLVKGSLVFVQGSLKITEGEKDGVKVNYVSVKVSGAGSEVKFLDRKGQEEREPGSEG
jgi:single-strand DNA-binding protein